MAAAATAPPPVALQDVTIGEAHHASNEQNIHTPPASDLSSHGRKGDDDDAASSSDLSDLDDQFEGGQQPSFVQDEPMGDTSSTVKPDHYEGGIPIFKPVRRNWVAQCFMVTTQLSRPICEP
jgi:hypothetical protein